MIIAFIIWSLVAILFVIFGVSARKSKEAVGFFSGVKPPEVKDVKAYNYAVSRLWFIFALLYEILGVPFLFFKQNSPYFVIIMILIMPLIIGMVVVYLRIEGKYRK